MTNNHLLKNKINNFVILFFILFLTWLTGIYIIYNLSFKNLWGGNLYPEGVLSIHNYEQYDDNSLFSPQFKDPHIFILPPTYRISSTMIMLNEPVSNNTFIEIYYAEMGNHIIEENSVKEYLSKGNSRIIIHFPSAVYTTLRYDINIFDKTFKIKGIYVSGSKINEIMFIEKLTNLGINNTNIFFIILIIDIFIILLWVFCVKRGYTDRFVLYFFNSFQNIKNNPSKIIKRIIVMICIFVIAVIIERFFSVFLPTNESFSAYRLLFATIGLMLYCLIIQ